MRPFTTSTITAIALASAALGFAGAAAAAPVGPSTASATIDKLQADGFRVIIEKIGSGGLDQCAVRSVRPGQTISRMDSGSGDPGSSSDIVTTVTAMTVYVALTC